MTELRTGALNGFFLFSFFLLGQNLHTQGSEKNPGFLFSKTGKGEEDKALIIPGARL